MNRFGSTLFQGGGTGVHCGTSGHYIIHQQNMSAFQPGKWSGSKCSTHVSGTLWGCQTRLSGCWPNPAGRPAGKGPLHPPGQRRAQQRRLVEPARTAAGRMKRNSRNKIKFYFRKFGLHTGEQQFSQVAGNPHRTVILQVTERRADCAFIAHCRTGRGKGGRFTGTGKTGVVVLHIAGHWIAAADTKRRFDPRGVRKAIPAKMRESVRGRQSAVHAVAGIKQIKHVLSIKPKRTLFNAPSGKTIISTTGEGSA